MVHRPRPFAVLHRVFRRAIEGPARDLWLNATVLIVVIFVTYRVFAAAFLPTLLSLGVITAQ